MKARNNEGSSSGVLAIISLLMILPAAVWYGFAIKVLWGWFAVPLHVAAIGVWEGAGLFLLVRMLVADYETTRVVQQHDEHKPIQRFAWGVAMTALVPAIAIGMGAVYHALS